MIDYVYNLTGFCSLLYNHAPLSLKKVSIFSVRIAFVAFEATEKERNEYRSDPSEQNKNRICDHPHLSLIHSQVQVKTNTNTIVNTKNVIAHLPYPSLL